VTRVRVVVVNYNGGDLTVDCLRSLVATRWRADRLEVVLVDNASTDGVVARVRTELPVVTVIESDRNLGFAGGCNLGMRDRADVDFVALVNSDATVDPGWLAPLVDALAQDSSLGAACPKVIYAGDGLIDNVGVEQGKWGRGADRGHLEPDRGQYDAPADVFAWCGAAVLLRGSYLDAVGEFDERLFLYCEDLELAWRGRASGWRYRTVPESVVRHVHGATSGAGSPLQRFYNLRNALLVAVRHAPLSTAITAAARSLAAIPYAAIRDPRDVATRARAFGGFVRLAPAMLRARAHDRAKARRYSRRPMDERAAYTGVDNLEVMSSAVKFAGYMRDIIATAAGPAAAKPRVLDFGAGTGTIAERVTELGYDVTCLEPDESLRALLGELRLPTVPDPEAAAAIGPFDVVYAINVIEHIDDDVAALAQLRSLLRPGGKLVIFVPAFPMLYSEMDRRIGHFRRYRLKALASVAERAGFVIDRAGYVDSLGFFGSLVYKWFFSRDGKISEWMVGTYDRYVFPVSTGIDPFASRLLGRNALVLAHRD
jgi:N-acetylglucosaminyl-diphospho-decaprenol L-rhamnosyltransferase